MVQELTTKPSMFGRLGKGLAKGLSETIPKEIERERLSEGLKQFSRESPGRTPMENMSALYSIPGITPQMIQTYGELAQRQNQTNAYSNLANRTPSRQQPQTENNLYSGKASPQVREQVSEQAFPNQQPQRTPNVGKDEFGQPQVLNKNPLDESMVAVPPWSPQQRNDRRLEYRNMGFTGPESDELAADDEQRERQAPETYKQQYSELQGRQKESRESLKRHLEKKTHKKEDKLFEDITGEMQIALERGMERDLRTKPKASVEDVANDWSNKALDIVKTKDNLKKLANTRGVAGMSDLLKGTETLDKLKQYGDIFKDAGDSEEYYNLLRSEFGLSPQGSAVIAYPPSEKVSQYIDNFKKGYSGAYTKLNPAYLENISSKAAIELGKLIGDNDSPLAIARELSLKYPNFNQQAFFKQLSDDEKYIRLNERQRREVAEGTKDILPNWADIMIFPYKFPLSL